MDGEVMKTFISLKPALLSRGKEKRKKRETGTSPGIDVPSASLTCQLVITTCYRALRKETNAGRGIARR